jgi:hypothetical protein
MAANPGQLRVSDLLDPRHVHVFQDGARILKFDIENWTVMEGKMTPKARRDLDSLRQEGMFDEKSEI